MLNMVAVSLLSIVPSAECPEAAVGAELVVESKPRIRFKANGRTHQAPKVFDVVNDDTVEFLTEPPVVVNVGCPTSGTTKVRFTHADEVRFEDEATVPLVATGATIAGMGAVIGLVGLLLIDPEEPTPSLVLGITGGSLVTVGAVPLAIAGINVATTPPNPHMVDFTFPNGERVQEFYEVDSARRVRLK